MRRATFSCVVLALVGFTGLLDAQPITIRGRVLDSQGAGAEGIEVQLVPVLSRYEEARLELEPRVLEPEASAQSDAHGLFEIQAPEAGFWRLLVAGSDALPTSLSFVGEPLLEPTTVGALHLQPAARTHVTARDATGMPAAGAVIRASDDEAADRRRRTSPWTHYQPLSRTDAAGGATVTRDADFGLHVGAWLPGHIAAAAPSGAAESLTLHLARGIRRHVKVLDATGDTLADIVIRVDGWAAAVSGDGGMAAIDTEPGGSELEFIVPDGRRLTRCLRDDDGIAAPLEVVVPDPQVTTGVVLDAVDQRPLAGAFVTPGRDLGRMVRTDERGGFQVLTGEDDGYLTVVAQGYLREAERLSATGGPRTVQLERAVNLVGRVLDAQGEAVADARLEAAPDPEDLMSGQTTGPYREATTDLFGEFVLSRLAAVGRYLVTATKDGYAPGERLVRDPLATEAEGSLDFVLDRGSSAYGQVVSSAGAGVTGASIVLAREVGASVGRIRRLLSDGLNNDVFEATTGAEGAFTVSGLRPAHYRLEVRAPGYARQTVLGLEVLSETRASDLGVVTLEPGVRVNGRLLDADGAPVAGARVQVEERNESMGTRTNNQELSLTSAVDGGFVIDDRREGEELSFYIRCDGYVSQSVPGVLVEAGKVIEIVMKPAVSIRGRVLTPDGGRAAGARVEVARESGGRSYGGSVRRHWLRTQTDELGQFELENVEPGDVRLAAESAEWLRVEIGNIDLPPGRDLEDVEITLRRGARLEGRVLGPDGGSIQDAVVRVEDPASRPGAAARTDGDGYYVMGAIEEGRQVFTAHAPEAGLSATEELTLEPGVNRLDFFLQNGVPVSGRVLTTRGVAVEDALILASRSRDFGGSQPSARSNPDGSFRLENVRSGAHRLEVAHPDLALVSPLEPLEVGDQPVLGLELRMTPGSPIVGFLSGLTPYELAGTSIWASRLSGWAEGLVASDGSYRIPNVAPGDWVVMAATSDGRREEGSIEVAEGATETSIDLAFEDGLVLSGLVLRGGERQSGIHVSATGHDAQASASGSTSHEGRFVLRGLEAGTYTLRLSSSTTGLAHTQTLELRRDREITIEIEGSLVSGVVVEADGGSPIPRAVVQLEPLPPQPSGSGGFSRSRSVQGATCDDLGRFTLTDVAAGSYRMTVTRPGYASHSEVLEVGSAETLAGLEFELAEVAGLVFRVISHLGTPVASLDWAVLDSTQQLQAGGTEPATSTGLVRLTTVPDGHWTVLLAIEGSATQRLQVQAPETESTVTLEAAARVTVRVEELVDDPARAVLTVRSLTGERFRSLAWGPRLVAEWGLFNGQTLVDDLPSGRWILTVTSDDDRRWDKTVTVEPGDQEVALD